MTPSAASSASADSAVSGGGRPFVRRLIVLAGMMLTACMPTAGADVSKARESAVISAAGRLPDPIGPLAQAAPVQSEPGNSALAADFMELSFGMESGRRLPAFSRFEGSVTVRLAGQVPQSAATEFARLSDRMRREAGVSLTERASGPASITIEFLPRARIRETYANVACFVAPRVSNWAEFRASRDTPIADWTTLVVRERLAIFIPSDGAAQEVRDCLHEELAQALGPLNDLYRLSDSVFNDDNFHTTLTGFDMLMLRATYAPELRAGMSPSEVAARLPAIFARIHPQGVGGGRASFGPTPRIWINSIETALGQGRGRLQREEAARFALAQARAAGWRDGRLGLSLFALGRLTLSSDPDTALPALAEARKVYLGLPGGRTQAAHVEMQLAAYALSQGDQTRALALVNAAMPVAQASENAALSATLMLMKAEALQAQGHAPEAAALRLDSRGWARYGFGGDSEVRAREAEIALLARRRG